MRRFRIPSLTTYFQVRLWRKLLKMQSLNLKSTRASDLFQGNKKRTTSTSCLMEKSKCYKCWVISVAMNFYNSTKEVLSVCLVSPCYCSDNHTFHHYLFLLIIDLLPVLPDWLTAGLTDWLTDDWLAGWLTDCLTDGRDGQTDWLTIWLGDWLWLFFCALFRIKII